MPLAFIRRVTDKPSYLIGSMSRRAEQSCAAGHKQRTAEVQLVQEKTVLQKVFQWTLNEVRSNTA